jgi:phosphoglycerol transferase MdoB-like AlkP superfamily enzyme
MKVLDFIVKYIDVNVEDLVIKRTPLLRGVFWAFILIFLLNVLWVGFGFFLSIERPLLNIDYLLCFFFLRRHLVVFFFFLLTFANETILNLASIYHFGILSFIKSTLFISNLSLLNTTTLMLVSIAVLICLYFKLINSLVVKKTSWSAMVFVLLTFTMLDVANGSFFISNSNSTQFFNLNLVGSGFKHTAKRLILELSPVGQMKDDSDRNSANREIVKLLDKHKDRSVLIVVVESMGNLIDHNLNSYIFNSLKFKLNGNYSMNISNREFKGATTSNELKILCGFSGDYRNVISKASILCVPKISNAQGRPSVAIHGFDGGMFSRNLWWQNIGFKEVLFKKDLNKKGIPNCGGMFSGSCDIETLSIVRMQLTAKPKLVYFLTLNTHLPFIPRVHINDNLARLCDEAKVGSDICSLEAEHFAFLDSLLNMLETLPYAKKPVVIISGDHPPPFIDRKKSSHFSDINVPMIILEPIKLGAK